MVEAGAHDARRDAGRAGENDEPPLRRRLHEGGEALDVFRPDGEGGGHFGCVLFEPDAETGEQGAVVGVDGAGLRRVGNAGAGEGPDPRRVGQFFSRASSPLMALW